MRHQTYGYLPSCTVLPLPLADTHLPSAEAEGRRLSWLQHSDTYYDYYAAMNTVAQKQTWAMGIGQ